MWTAAAAMYATGALGYWRPSQSVLASLCLGLSDALLPLLGQVKVRNKTLFLFCLLLISGFLINIGTCFESGPL